MKLLFVTDVFPPFSGSGGSGWSTYHLACGLRERRHEVRVVVAAPAMSLVKADYDGFSVWRPSGSGRTFPDAALNLSGLGVGRAVRMLRHQWGPDVIHAQHVLSALVARRVAQDTPYLVTVRDHWPVCFYGTKLANAPCPACLNGTCSPCNPRRGNERAGAMRKWTKATGMRAVLRARRGALRHAAAVVAVSEAIRREVAAAVPAAHVHVVPNGIMPVTPAAPTIPDLPEKYFLYVGKLAPHKGADQLPAIVADLPPVSPPFLICGDGPEAVALRAADSTGARLRLLGIVPNDEVLALMARAVALVSPNRWEEPLSRTHLEAMSVGCPIVATDTGGTGEMVANGITGFLVPRDDTAGLAARLAALAADGILRARMGQAARAACARTYNMANVAARMEALYEAAVGNAR